MMVFIYSWGLEDRFHQIQHTRNSNKGENLMNRRTAREKAVQILFQIDMNENDLTKTMQMVLGDEDVNPFLHVLVDGVIANRHEIDQLIGENLDHWSFERIALVEKTILRIATFEMKYLDDIPETVSIDEAVELAKKFGDTKSGKFVNGVLSKMIK